MITTDVVRGDGGVETRKPPVKLLAGTVVVAGTLATAGLLLDSEIAAPLAARDDITIVPLDALPPTTVAGFTSSERQLRGRRRGLRP